MTNVGKSELNKFFAGFAGALAGITSTVNQAELSRYFVSVSRLVKSAERQQRSIDKLHATGFNVFNFIEPDENTLSDVIADLLNPEGHHGQGDLFLELLCQQIGAEAKPDDLKHAIVQREAVTHGSLKYRRRIDILVHAGVILAIENKVDSGEQRDQVKDYLEHLRYLVRHSRKKFILIYLTPNGRQPESLRGDAFRAASGSGELLCWSYQIELLEWLHACRKHCKAAKIRHFLTDFIEYNESQLKREPVNNDEEEDEKN